METSLKTFLWKRLNLQKVINTKIVQGILIYLSQIFLLLTFYPICNLLCVCLCTLIFFPEILVVNYTYCGSLSEILQCDFLRIEIFSYRTDTAIINWKYQYLHWHLYLIHCAYDSCVYWSNIVLHKMFFSLVQNPV